MPGNVQISTSSVPVGWCFQNFQNDWAYLVSLLSGNLAQDPSWNVGIDTPAPEDQGKPWFKYNTDGTPDKAYVFISGVWAAKHPIPAGTIIMWEGLEVNIPTFDGGLAGAITPFTGPMWERVTQMDARFPIGPGTLPSTTVVPILGTGGEEKHSLTVAELAPHTHTVRAVLANTDGGTQVERLRKMSDTEVSSDQARTDSTGGTVTAPSTTPVVEGHNTIPPFYSVWFLRKTARSNYVA